MNCLRPHTCDAITRSTESLDLGDKVAGKNKNSLARHVESWEQKSRVPLVMNSRESADKNKVSFIFRQQGKQTKNRNEIHALLYVKTWLPYSNHQHKHHS